MAYSATKAGLIGMTRTLAMELGGDGITVNAVAPGPIATELFRKSNPEGAPQTQRIIDSIVVKRLGTDEDVARATMFFLSPDNGFVTGQVLYVCGGTTLEVAPSRPPLDLHSLFQLPCTLPEGFIHEPPEQT